MFKHFADQFSKKQFGFTDNSDFMIAGATTLKGVCTIKCGAHNITPCLRRYYFSFF